MCANYRDIELYPIAKDTLEIDTIYSYPIYIHLKDNIYKKLLNENEKYTKKIDNTLVAQGVKKLYLKESDRKKYQNDTQKYLTRVIGCPKVPTVKKASIINKIACLTMENIFNNRLSPELIEGVGNNIETTVKFILNDKYALNTMLSVTSYDYYTYTHSVDVSTYAIGFCSFLKIGEEDITLVGKAAMLHDIGKREVRNSIITKNGRLTTEEYEEVKKHPSFGVEILKNLGECNETLLHIIEQHHEKVDGSGYPKGLRESQIDNYAKILSIVDIFNALITKRSYKEAMSSYDAFMIMQNEMSDGLCPYYLKEFKEFLGTTIL